MFDVAAYSDSTCAACGEQAEYVLPGEGGQLVAFCAEHHAARKRAAKARARGLATAWHRVRCRFDDGGENLLAAAIGQQAVKALLSEAKPSDRVTFVRLEEGRELVTEVTSGSRQYVYRGPLAAQYYAGGALSEYDAIPPAVEQVFGRWLDTSAPLVIIQRPLD